MQDLIRTRWTAWSSSVDELDASVALEADGVNDAVARSRYSADDVNDLARQLVARVPARFEAPSVADTPKDATSLRLAFRGVLFAIPGLLYLVVARLNSTTAAAYTLIGSMLIAWGLSQAVAVVAHRVAGRGSVRGAALALRFCLATASAVAIAAVAISAVLGCVGLVAMGLGQILYVLAATVLLFYGADKFLALALIPGTAGSILYLANGPVPPAAAIGAGLASIALALLAAAHCASSAASHAETSTVDKVRRTDLTASVPFVLYGLLSGIVVAYIPLRVLHRPPSHQVHPIDLTIVPLVVSMGWAEIELLRLRVAGGRLMRASRRLSDYQRRAARLIAAAQGRLLAVLTVSSVAFGIVMSLTSGFNRRDLILILSYMTLGAALLAALILVAVDRVDLALMGFLSTGAAGGAGLLVGQACGASLSIESTYFAACLLLLMIMTVLVIRVLRDPIALA
jgi:hypothetical protein